MKQEKSSDKEEKQEEPIPKELNEKSMRTTMTDLSTVIKEKMSQLKDLATMEIKLPVHTRMQKRLESIKKMSSAESIKVEGHWKTYPPKMHITKLEGRKINNDEAEITFGVYDLDEEGNKKLFIHYSEIIKENGDKIKRETSAEYRVIYEVIERIKNRRPITREIIKIDREDVN